MSQRIEDYAIIGDPHTAALVGSDGSIDWLCLPHFDSPACFAGLSGRQEPRVLARSRPAGGAEHRAGDAPVVPRRTPSSSRPSSTRRRARCASPTACRCGDGYPQVVRSVEGVSGTVDMRMELVVRFDYGDVVPWVDVGRGAHPAHRRPRLRRPVAPGRRRGRGHADGGRLHRERGSSVPVHPGLVPLARGAAPAPRRGYAVDHTEALVARLGGRTAATRARTRDAVMRSLITLKALTYAPTGGIVAAVTTSLPEALGGVRNWDYRYCWLRDATLTLESLMRGRLHEEALAWRDWLLRAVAGDVAEAADHVRAGRGAAPRPSARSTWLPGYEGSAPVRIGNAASEPVPARRLRRGDVRALLESAQRRGRWTRRPAWELQSAADRLPRDRVDASPTTASGRCAGRGATSPTPR